MPFAPSSFLFLVAMPFAPSSFLFQVIFHAFDNVGLFAGLHLTSLDSLPPTEPATCDHASPVPRPKSGLFMNLQRPHALLRALLPPKSHQVLRLFGSVLLILATCFSATDRMIGCFLLHLLGQILSEFDA